MQTLNLQGKVVYDVGAANGLTALHFARAVGLSGQVVAFEPNPLFFQRVKEHFRLNNFFNAVAVNCAVGEKPAISQLAFDTKFMGGGSMAPMEIERIKSIKSSKTILVQVDSLDNLMKKHSLLAPNLVKVDVQGLEREVLKGMTEIIQLHKPSLHVEVHGIPYETWREENLAWIIRFLKGFGYDILHVETGEPPILTEVQQDHHIYACPT